MNNLLQWSSLSHFLFLNFILFVRNVRKTSFESYLMYAKNQSEQESILECKRSSTYMKS